MPNKPEEGAQKPPQQEQPQPHPQHIEIAGGDSAAASDDQQSPGLRNSKGWDGKLRVSKNALVSNPEALSDPEYSDDDNVNPGEVIPADEDLLDGEPSDTEELNITHSRVRSIPSLQLQRFKKVASLCLRQNAIQDIDGLASLAGTLQELDLYDNLIPVIQGLDELASLTWLDLSFNKIKRIEKVNHLKQLTDLFFVSNKIREIENLEGLDKLRMLELGSNRIRELQNLDSLKALEELYVAKNKIRELHGLGGLPKLRLLSIQSNRIRDLSPLKDVPQLEELYITHNALESLEGLQHNTKLQVLDISNNQIVSLKGLGPLKELTDVWASYNQIADFAELDRELRDKEKLTTVYLEGNPLQLRSPPLYRNKVRLALPQVTQIDATYIRLP